MAQVIFEFQLLFLKDLQVIFLEALQAPLRDSIQTKVDLIHLSISPKIRALVFLLPMDLTLVCRFRVVPGLATVLQFPIDFFVRHFPWADSNQF